MVMPIPAAPLIRNAGQPLAGQLAARLAERIRARLLPPGARLPSVRECARQYGISPHTVVAAYDQLQGQGLVDVRRQRGFFVRDWATAQTARSTRAAGPLARPVMADASTLIRGMCWHPSNKPQPGMGVLPPDWMETPFLPAALRRLVNGPALQEISLQYGDPAGDAALRRSLAQRLSGIDIPAAPEHILTTVGATHALDVVRCALLRAGDAVMVEEPGWAIEYARLESLGMRILPVPRLAEGPDLDVVERYCRAGRAEKDLRPRLLISVSVLHNPTGYSLTPGNAHRLLQLAARHGFYIVEDDSYGHLAPERTTRLCALDGLQRTIYIGGFAKMIAPNWRVGFLAASQALYPRLLETKLLATLTTPTLFERALAACIDQGQLRRHGERLRERLDAARTRAVRLALGAGCRFMSEPAGLFGWVDTGVDTEALAQRLLDAGYLIAPGALFYARRPPGTLMRINFATSQDAAFWKMFERVRDGMASKS
jgi:DNA-binding transcriptional MocR family regulator